jgi:nitrile hydratase accessory protein
LSLPERDHPGFDEPWQATALALADTLSRNGLFTPAAWSEALGAALRRAEAAGRPDNSETYYAAVLEALEELLAARGAIPPDMRSARLQAWRQAHLETPHGEPVVLRAADRLPET